MLGETHCSRGIRGSYEAGWKGQRALPWRPQPPCATRPRRPAHSLGYYLSISVHHKMSSFSFMKTGKCWSLPCFMEFDLVVMVLTLLNWKTSRGKEE